MKVLFAALCAMALMLPATAAAQMPATLPGGGQVNTFSGTCSYDGFIVFRKPMGVVPELNHLTFVTHGTCTGVLDGETVIDEKVSFYNQSDGLMSCTEGLQGGPGLMHIGGATIPFRFREVRFTTGSKFNMEGKAGGFLDGVGSTNDDSVVLTQKCLDNALKRVTFYASSVGTISG